MNVVQIIIDEAEALQHEREYQSRRIENAIFWLEIGGYKVDANTAENAVNQPWSVTHWNGSVMAVDYYHLCGMAFRIEDKYNEL